MRRFVLSILWLVFFCISAGAGNVITIKHTVPKSPSGFHKIKPTMVITNPKKGNHFKSGNIIQIRWKAIGDIKDKCVSLDLFKGVLYVKQIIRKVCVNGIDWKIPTDFKGGQYRIRLISKNKKILTYSGVFSIIASKSDLYISSRDIGVMPRNPDMGDKIYLNITVTNGGVSTSKRTTAKITITTPDGKTLHFNPNIPPISGKGGRYAVIIPVKLDKYHHGKYTVKVEIDPNKATEDKNRHNNTATYAFTAKALPDLGVCIDVNKRPRPFKKVTIRAYVINRGDAPSKPCNLVIAVRDDTYTTMHKYNFTIPALRPHQIYSSAHIRYKWHDFSNKKKYFYALIDSKNQVKETSEANFASGFYYLTRPGGKHGEKNKVSCSWMSPYPVDKSSVGIK